MPDQSNHISVMFKKDTDNFNFPLTLEIKRDIRLCRKDTQAHYLEANILYFLFFNSHVLENCVYFMLNSDF